MRRVSFDTAPLKVEIAQLHDEKEWEIWGWREEMNRLHTTTLKVEILELHGERVVVFESCVWRWASSRPYEALKVEIVQDYKM